MVIIPALNNIESVFYKDCSSVESLNFEEYSQKNI